MRTALKIALSVLCALLCGLLFTLLTHTGNRWLWTIACHQMPELKGELVEGSVRNTLVFTDLGWANDDITVATEQTSIQLNLRDLLNKRLTIDDLVVHNLQIELSASKESSKNPIIEPVKLPDITLPIAVTVHHLQIQELLFQQGNTHETLKQLQLVASAEESTIHIESLKIEHTLFSSELSGQITLSGNYPLSIMANVQPESDSKVVEQLPVHLSETYIKVTGSATNYHLNVSTAVNALLPEDKTLPLSVKLAASGTLEQLTIKKLVLLNPDQGSLILSGQLGWTDGLSLNGAITIDAFKPETLLPDYPGILNGMVQVRFNTDKAGWQLSIPELAIKGELKDQPVSATGTIDLDSTLNGHIDQLALQFGNNQLSVHGALNQKLNLTATLSANELALIHPDLSGSVTGSARIEGNRASPDIRFNLVSQTLGVKDLRINNIDLGGHLTKDSTLQGSATLELESVTQKKPLLGKTKLTLAGTESHHKLTLNTETNDTHVLVSARGEWKNRSWKGLLTEKSISSPYGDWSLASPVSIQLKDDSLSLNDFCLVSPPTRLCLTKLHASKASGEASLTLSQLNSQTIKPFFPEGFDWQAVVSAHGDIRWQQNLPDLHLHIESTPGTIKTLALEGTYDNFVVDTTIKNNHLNGTLMFDSPTLGKTDLTVAVTDLEGERKLQGQLLINDFLLAVLSPFAPNIEDIKGTLSANGQLAGTLKTPLFYGKCSLLGGALSGDREIVKVTETNIDLLAEGNRAKVTGHLKVNQGELGLGGNISWENLPAVTGKLEIKGKHIDVKYPGYGTAEISPDLLIQFGELITLTGTIVIPTADIEVKSLPENAVTLSKDVVIIKPGETGQAHAVAHPLKMDVDIVLGDDISLDALGLRAELTGELKLLLQAEKTLEGQGTINLIDGRLRRFGQNLLIKEGHIIFQGPLDSPYLLVNAYRDPDTIEGDVIVGINVSGPALSPQWSLYSQPAMSQEEQLSYLLRGRPLGTEDDNLASTLVGLGVGQLGGFVASAGESLGFSDVVLDTEGTGDNTKVTIGGYIAPGLRLQYGAGVFNSIGEVKIRYELMPRLYIQAVSGLDQAVDIFYQFTIGPSQTKEPTDNQPSKNSRKN